MSGQSPPVRIAGIHATPLKHTSPVPLGLPAAGPGGQGFGGGAPDDPLGLLASHVASPSSGLRPPVSPSVVAQAASAVDANLDVEQMLQALLAQAAAEGVTPPPAFDPRALAATTTGEAVADMAVSVRSMQAAGAWDSLKAITGPLALVARRRDLFVSGPDKGGGVLSVHPLLLARFDALFRTKSFDALSAELVAALEEE